ncbi:MAG: sulfotransferase domain-containing protein [Gammaproteobacteria bacterium]|nr:sulfotransferase domain-containing protein [Gammaproteobacteria bacterium]
MDNRSKIAIWCDAFQRLVMVNTASRIFPLYIVTEYPKSGGTWIAQVLSECLELPFPRNIRPNWQSAILHGHIKYSPTMSNVVVVYRDGRDCMVSLYFHSLFQNEKNSPYLVKKTRRDMGFDELLDVNNNLPKFIEYIFEKGKNHLNPYKFTWAEFVRNWSNRNCVVIRYESMIGDGVAEIQRALLELRRDDVPHSRIEAVVEKFAFANQAKRKPGEENRSSFLRRGEPGDWKNKFNQASAKVFDYYAGKELIELGYEHDNSWVAKMVDGFVMEDTGEQANK